MNDEDVRNKENDDHCGFQAWRVRFACLDTEFRLQERQAGVDVVHGIKECVDILLNIRQVECLIELPANLSDFLEQWQAGVGFPVRYVFCAYSVSFTHAVSLCFCRWSRCFPHSLQRIVFVDCVSKGLSKQDVGVPRCDFPSGVLVDVVGKSPTDKSCWLLLDSFLDEVDQLVSFFTSDSWVLEGHGVLHE